MKKLIFTLTAILFFGIVRAQVGINTVTPNAQLEIKSTNAAVPTNLDGVIIPKVNVFASGMTAAQQGMLVYLTTTVSGNLPGFYYWDNTSSTWISFGNKQQWNLTGNSGTDASNYIGTKDNQDLSIRTNAVEKARVLTDGKFIIGNTLPADNFRAFSKLDIGSNGDDNDITLRHSGSDIPAINILRSFGTMKAPAILPSGEEVGSLRFWSFSNSPSVNGFSGYDQAGRVASFVESVSGGVVSAGLKLNGSMLTNGLYVNSAGNVGIGTTTPTTLFHINGSGAFRLSSGAASGRVLVSDATGIASWGNPSAIASGTLDQAYDFGGAGIGRLITADNGPVEIAGTDGLVSTGTINAGAIMPSGSGVRMVWNPRKAAFRAGTPSPTGWDDANVGTNSVAFGSNTRATGICTTALGNNTFAGGERATALGIFTTATAEGSMAMGYFSNATGLYSTAMGNLNHSTGYGAFASGSFSTASGMYSNVFGSNNTAYSYGETVFGIGATSYTPSTGGTTTYRTANASDRLFVIGNAIDSNNNNLVDAAERSDALVILKNGNTGIGIATPQELLHVAGKMRLADGSQAVGRILVSDSNGTGTWQTNSATNAWGLGGNALTVPATNFIGTTDAQPLVIRTNNTEKARILSNGFVGLGTNDPDRELEVYGSGTQYQRITSSGTSEVGIELKRSGTASDWQMRNDGGIFFIGQSNDDLVTVSDIFRIGGSSVTPAVDNFVTLGQNALRWTAVHATNGVIQTSDANDKKQMLPLQYGLDKIKALRPVSFKWKDEKIDNNSTHLGFVAQEVKKVLPEVIVDSDWVEGKEGQGKIWEKSERLGMKYSEIIPVLVKAFQEQQEIIENQKTQLESQNEIITNLLQRMAKLEQR